VLDAVRRELAGLMPDGRIDRHVEDPLSQLRAGRRMAVAQGRGDLVTASAPAKRLAGAARASSSFPERSRRRGTPSSASSATSSPTPTSWAGRLVGWHRLALLLAALVAGGGFLAGRARATCDGCSGLDYRSIADERGGILLAVTALAILLIAALAVELLGGVVRSRNRKRAPLR
jgi:hypothetical protein